MIIENKFTTAKYKILYAINLVLILSISAYYFFEWNRPYVKDLIFSIIVLLILIYITGIYVKIFYFYINSDGSNVSVKYYNSHPFLRKYKALEIPKPYFFDYQIQSSFFGLKKELILIIKNQNGIFKYPAISISAYDKNQLQKLIKLLNELKMNK